MSPPREADLLILDARVVTATGDVLDRASIVVSDGHIQDIVAGGTERTAATVISGNSYTVVPGLIDTHAHLLAKSPRVDSDAAMTAYLNEILPALLDEYLAAGFTSVLSNGDFWPAVADAKARVNTGAVRGRASSSSDRYSLLPARSPRSPCAPTVRGVGNTSPWKWTTNSRPERLSIGSPRPAPMASRWFTTLRGTILDLVRASFAPSSSARMHMTCR